MGDAEQLIAEAAGGYLLEEGHTLLLSSLDESIIFKMDGPLAWLCLGAFYIQDKLSPGPQSSDLPLVQTPAYTQRANKQTNKQTNSQTQVQTPASPFQPGEEGREDA